MIDVERTICNCDDCDVYQVDIDYFEPVWLCINCLIGLEEW